MNARAPDTAADIAVAFLEKLRPGGPWVLSAAVPDDRTKIITITAVNTNQAAAFVREHNERRNLYYSVNPTRGLMKKKAAKVDIARIEYALADLDPADGESSDDAKERYLGQLNGSFEPKPTAIIDSGGGIQALWRLKEPIELGEPVEGQYSEQDKKKIADVEGRVKAGMLRLGSQAGTQNIDRILRLPGTINLPDKVKRDKGRVRCPTELLMFNGLAYPLEAFPPAPEASRAKSGESRTRDESGSGHGYRFMGARKDAGDDYEAARAAILADEGKAGEWAGRVDERQLRRAYDNWQAPIAPLFSDSELTDRFVKRFRDELRFVAARNQWFRYDGGCWREEKTRLVFDLIRRICCEAAAEANKEGKRLASYKTVAAVEKMAQADRALAATIDQWDCDPWMLNTPKGTIDLKTGKMRAHDPDDYLTKITAVAPGGDCPKWKNFQNEITGGDAELVAYKQRKYGYCLTGDISEQVLFYQYGTGNNGKTVEKETISGIFGSYHGAAEIDTFTAAQHDDHPVQLARLCGARLVTAVETEANRSWRESRIKQITGGDPITARFMRQDPFTFHPICKLSFDGNHKPVLRTVNKAISRRFHLIPFTVTIPDARINQNLTKELREEWPGILKWMIQGCLEWQRGGLKPPRAVIEATKDYLEGQDVLGEWIEECCERDANAWESTSDLFQSWKLWAEARGQRTGAVKGFSSKLEDYGGLVRAKNTEQTKRGFRGLRLKPEEKEKIAAEGEQTTQQSKKDEMKKLWLFVHHQTDPNGRNNEGGTLVSRLPDDDPATNVWLPTSKIVISDYQDDRDRFEIEIPKRLYDQKKNKLEGGGEEQEEERDREQMRAEEASEEVDEEQRKKQQEKQRQEEEWKEKRRQQNEARNRGRKPTTYVSIWMFVSKKSEPWTHVALLPGQRSTAILSGLLKIGEVQDEFGRFLITMHESQLCYLKRDFGGTESATPEQIRKALEEEVQEQERMRAEEGM